MTQQHLGPTVHDSPDPLVAEHVRRYLATDGASGYREGGVTNLVLTHRGRKTGKLHRTGLFYGRDDDRYILIASGSSITHTHPQWYLNLMANPEAEVQILAERFTVRARGAEGAERQRLWGLMTELAPVYHTYEARSRRVIPVVVLERGESAQPG
ncbi:nitroreductase family deazaflavin-dependent oxidoreductase [Nocardia goodfellowii]|uniref:Deazaflavin-dependent oxidoreductase (Nitroreductase family) n=1 Tax=Nocardia goodfellowii TaxID=882446 RepID=A0ABS4QJZ5_9NOCA|nr:nitroreductase family deazaflavin-dependent oxidoreductase [Nocardia goodfellowii]MBP2190991.1 deazaflavin-dependent oxidoreductase (nitroreductase family) [Nocardia goodfellowii]